MLGQDITILGLLMDIAELLSKEVFLPTCLKIPAVGIIVSPVLVLLGMGIEF